jgi:molybdopterin-guanine dinucleotide biosynthesis protein
MERLVPILRARARRAGVPEHAQRDFNVDQPLEDSYRVASGLL